MILTNNITAKRIAFAAAALMLAFFAPAAMAQSDAELQAQVADLLATIAELETQVGGTTSAATCAYTFTTAMGAGDTGPAVIELQKFLNSDPETRVAASGAGSVGMETEYYGPATAAAVSKFQVKYRADVLTPSGLVNPTGYFGSASIAKANALCGGSAAEEGAAQTPDLSGLTPAEQLSLATKQLKGEGSFEDFDMVSAPDDEIHEGGDAQVYEAEFEITGGDLLLARVDFAVSGDTEAPYDYFESVTLWIDGEEIRTQPVNTPDYWDQKDDITTIQAFGINASNSGYEVAAGDELWGSRFPYIGKVLEDGEEYTITIGFEAQDGVGDLPMEWYMFVDDEGLRALTADDFNVYDGDQGVNGIAHFTFEEAGEEDELSVGSSNDDPEATTFQLEEDESSDMMTVFAFELDAGDSDNDIEVNELVMSVDVSDTETYEAIVNDAQLMVDGETYDDVEVADGNTDTATLTFDTDGLTVDAGKELTAELQLEFAALATADEGTEVSASISSAQADLIEAEGADDLDDDQLDGSASGETHTLRTEGVTIDMVAVDESLRENDDTDETDDEGIFEIEFEVTAFEEDMYINASTTRGTTEGNAGVNFLVLDSNGDAYTSGTATTVLTSSADKENSQFLVEEGEMETFTLTVEVDPAAGGFYQLQLYSVNSDETAGSDPSSHQRAFPEKDFETDPLSI